MESGCKGKNCSQSAKMDTIDVVLIDADKNICEDFKKMLEAEGVSAVTAGNGEEGLKLVGERKPQVVIVDLKTAGKDGIQEVLARIAKIDFSIVPIVVTGKGTIEAAVESMKAGAFDFITKPVDSEKLLETVRRGIKLSEIRKEQAGRGGEGLELKKGGKQEILLKGIDLLRESYAAGIDRKDLFDELKYLESEAKYHAESLGQVKKREKALLDIENHFKIVDEVIAGYDYRKNALIQILLELQAKLRWLPRHVLKWLSARLDVPLSRIYSIATFYEALSLEPRGAHTISVCLGTACHVRGGQDLLVKVSAILGIKPGETDARQLFTLKTVNCLGCCALAPVMQIDGDYYSNPSLDEMKKIFESYAQEESAVCLN